MEENTEVKKPTYDELNNYCNQLFVNNRELLNELNNINDTINKLPFLFKVLENAKYFSDEFVTECTKEIEFIMTPTQDNKETGNNK